VSYVKSLNINGRLNTLTNKSRLELLVKHEDIVWSLATRLQQNPRYDYVQVHYTYDKEGKQGECDIVAYNKHSIHYYEVKCHTNKQSYEHASTQFRRFKATHPSLNPKFIYITEDTVKRVRL
jgi:predicted AAA+ superfamily ATPase